MDICNKSLSIINATSINHYYVYSISEDIPPVLAHACVVLRLMYDVALDAFDKPVFCGSLAVRSPNLVRQSNVSSEV